MPGICTIFQLLIFTLLCTENMHWHGGSLSTFVIFLSPSQKAKTYPKTVFCLISYFKAWCENLEFLVFILILMTCMGFAIGIGNKLLHHPYGWDQRSRHYWQRSKKCKIWQPVKTSVPPVWEKMCRSQPAKHFTFWSSKKQKYSYSNC